MRPVEPCDVSSDSCHRVTEFDGEDHLDVGAERYQLANGSVVGVESERAFDPLGSILGWFGVRAGSPAVGASGDKSKL
jgi:hypothetical protein